MTQQMQWQRFSNPLDPLSAEITDSAARTFYVDAWASEMEAKGEEPWGAGEEIGDYAPTTPRSAERFAKKFIKAVEKANGGTKISELYERAATAPGKHLRDPTPNHFGHYLAMQAMGHGVSWLDDHPKSGIKIPEAHYYYDSLGGGSGEVSERFMSEI